MCAISAIKALLLTCSSHPLDSQRRPPGPEGSVCPRAQEVHCLSRMLGRPLSAGLSRTVVRMCVRVSVSALGWVKLGRLASNNVGVSLVRCRCSKEAESGRGEYQTSWPTATTRAEYFLGSPCLRTMTCAWSATQCAFVMMRLPVHPA